MRPITIAITAMGGQGGGVLADWIRELGERNGYYAQSTSVPGVAQRTGATIYYLELFPESIARERGREPVLSLYPVAGDVDIVIAAEWMEAGRAIQRGFVTPDRTLLVASTHRAYAVIEKTAPGNGIADSAVVMEAAQAAAKTLVCLDLQRIAEQAGSVISASLFGALAAAGALPFARADFEAVIGTEGKAAQSSLRAFGLAWDAVKAGALSPGPSPASGRGEQSAGERGKEGQREGRQTLATLIAALPAPARDFATAGVRQLLDYQDAAYARLYLERLAAVAALDTAPGSELSRECARHLALWMGYHDVIHVAAQKTRAGRLEEIRREVKAGDGDIVEPVEFMHPRLEEICDIMPRAFGAWLLGNATVRRLAARVFAGGRRVRTYRIGGFLMLFAVSSLRPLRRASLRYALEQERIEAWLGRLRRAAPANVEFATGIARCARLLKGYSDTQERGWHKYASLMAWVDAAPATAASATRLAGLLAAALADAEGTALAKELSAPPAQPA